MLGQDHNLKQDVQAFEKVRPGLVIAHHGDVKCCDFLVELSHTLRRHLRTQVVISDSEDIIKSKVRAHRGRIGRVITSSASFAQELRGMLPPDVQFIVFQGSTMEELRRAEPGLFS